MTRKALAQGLQMRDVTTEFLDECAIEYIGYGKPLHLARERLAAAWDVDAAVASQLTPGGTAPIRVREAIARSRRRLTRDRRTVKAKRDKLAAAAEQRARAIDALRGTT